MYGRLTFQPACVFRGLNKGLNCVCFGVNSAWAVGATLRDLGATLRDLGATLRDLGATSCDLATFNPYVSRGDQR